MDRFVTRLPREQKEKKRARAAEPRKTQATIGQLKVCHTLTHTHTHTHPHTHAYTGSTMGE